MGLDRWGYRIRQGVMRIRARLGLVRIDERPAERWLSAEALTLFRSMSPGDRLHALCVFQRLRERGVVARQLAQAALLHDVGKTRANLNLVYRTVAIVLGRFHDLTPIASSNPLSWRYPFFVHLHHPRLGAEMCKKAGCGPFVVTLVRQHEMPLETIADSALRQALTALQAADDCC